jgi:hypothetical protein
MSEDVLTINASWPGTTFSGEPGLVSGSLTLSRTAGGEFLLNLVVGPDEGGPADCEYLEFPLSAGHADALRAALAS